MCHYPIVYQISGRHPIIHVVATQFIHVVCLSCFDGASVLSLNRLFSFGCVCVSGGGRVDLPLFCSQLVSWCISWACLTFQLFIDSSWGCQYRSIYIVNSIILNIYQSPLYYFFFQMLKRLCFFCSVCLL